MTIQLFEYLRFAPQRIAYCVGQETLACSIVDSNERRYRDPLSR